MADFRVLSENFFNPHQFPAHTLTASTGTEVSGREVWRVGTGRRTAKNGWTAPSTGISYMRCACDQVRAPDMIALDGHNLAGETVALQYTSSTASGWQTRFSYTLPSATHANTRVTDAPGARAEDGLWVHRFATTANMPAATDFRIQIGALGGGVQAQIGLAWLGRSFTAKGLRPWEDEQRTLARGARVKSVLSGSLSARLSDLQGDQARYYVGDLAWSSGDPFIVVPHPDQAERGQVGFAPDGTRSMSYPTDWTHRVLEFDWVEHKPRVR